MPPTTDDPPAFGRDHARALRWYLTAGASAVQPRGMHVPETGVVGTGNSAVAPATPNPDTLCRYGRVDRALYACGETLSNVLRLAHGDAGEAVTASGLYATRRWQSVASLTAAAHAAAAEWAPRAPRRRHAADQRDAAAHALPVERGATWRQDAGPPAVRWVSYMLDLAHKDSHTPAEKAAFAEAEVQARALLASAEARFAAVLHATEAAALFFSGEAP